MLTSPAPGAGPEPLRDPLNLLKRTLAGHFVVEALAGEGRFGAVYKASQVGGEGPVAIKSMKLDVVLDASTAETFLTRVRDESRAQSKILHGEARVARSIGTGMLTREHDEHTPYAVYEWLEGRSLAATLRENDAGLPLGEAITLLTPCVEAIASAHDLGLFHGEINAGNFFVTRDSAGDPTLKVLDFGLAALVRRVVREIAPDAPETTMFSMVNGSPEHFDRTLGPIGPATDVYGIALVLLEVMGLRWPDATATFADLSKRALDPLNRATPRAFNLNVGDSVQDVLARAVARAPLERWADAGELWDALKTAVAKDRKRQQALTIPPPRTLPPATGPAPTGPTPSTEDPAQTFFDPLPPAHLLAAIQDALAEAPSSVKSSPPVPPPPPPAPVEEVALARSFPDEPTARIARTSVPVKSGFWQAFFKRPFQRSTMMVFVAGGVGLTVFVTGLTALLVWRSW